VAVATLGCGAAPEAHPGDARRVVSLAPAITDLVFALGAGNRLVGRTRWAAFPPEALAVPSIGDGLQPNVEVLAAQRPDLVLFYETPANAPALFQLGGLGIATRELPLDRLADVAAASRALGGLLGRPAHGDSLAAALEAWLAAAPPEPRWQIAFVISDTPLITIGAGSYLTELAERAGAANIFADLSHPSPMVSLETLAARDPDAIVVLADSGPPPPFLARPEWLAVRAARERRVVMLHGPDFDYPSVRAARAVREFRTALEALP
jgi:iron complex transport system substrate-binding protein